MGRRKDKRYIVRWLEEHPQIRLYLSRDDYEFLKKICDDNGISFRELLLKTIKDMRYVEEIIKKEVIQEIREGIINFLEGRPCEDELCEVVNGIVQEVVEYLVRFLIGEVCKGEFCRVIDEVMMKYGVSSIHVVGQDIDIETSF